MIYNAIYRLENQYLKIFIEKFRLKVIVL